MADSWAPALLDRSADLRARARRCRQLATGLTSLEDIRVLEQLADEYDAQADDAEQRVLVSEQDESERAPNSYA